MEPLTAGRAGVRSGTVPPGNVRSHRPFIAVLGVYIALALGYNLVVPIGESPDEATHLDYAWFLRERRALPRLATDDAGTEGIPQGGHPPLPYALAALVSLPAGDTRPVLVANPHFSFNRERAQPPNVFVHPAGGVFPYDASPGLLASHAMRLVSLLGGTLAVVAAYGLGRAIAPDTSVGIGAAAFVAFLPSFSFFSGTFNNDVPAAGAAGIGLLALVRWLRAPGRSAAGRGGLAIGAALMVKMTAIFLVPIAALVTAFRARDAGVRQALVEGGIVAGGVGLVAGWWIIRNIAVYGPADPSGWQAFLEAGEHFRRSVPLSAELGTYLNLQFRSLVGGFGWQTLWLPTEAYVGTGIVALLGVAGLATKLVRGPSVLGYVGVLRLATVFDLVVAQGRYLFVAWPAAATLLAVGVHALAPSRYADTALIGTSAALAGLSAYSLVAVVAPALTAPPGDCRRCAASRGRPDRCGLGHELDYRHLRRPGAPCGYGVRDRGRPHRCPPGRCG
jgi:4-amino-4-deoxy-L-arabinose transferase-like glycosyltransferase